MCPECKAEFGLRKLVTKSYPLIPYEDGSYVTDDFSEDETIECMDCGAEFYFTEKQDEIHPSTWLITLGRAFFT